MRRDVAKLREDVDKLMEGKTATEAGAKPQLHTGEDGGNIKVTIRTIIENKS